MGLSPEYIANETTARLIKRKAARMARFHDAEDMRQDLYVQLIQRAKHFDRTQGAPGPFIKLAVNCAANDLIAHHTAQCRDPRRCGSIEAPGFEQDRLAIGPDVQLADLRLDVTQAIAALPVDQRSMANELKTYAVAEICQRPGNSRGRVRQQLKHLRRHFEMCGFGKSQPSRATIPYLLDRSAA